MASCSTRGSTLRMLPTLPSPRRGEGAVSVKQLTPTTFCSPELDAADPLGLAADQALLELVDGGEGAALGQDVLELGPGRLGQLGRLGLDDVGALEDVVVLEQVGLEGEDLLHPQGPLLVPGAGQAEGLVPGRELEGPGPGVLGQGDAELLEHDALDVVLGLLLGQAERVDLDAVAEAAQLGVGDVVTLAADAVPELGEGPHLACFLDEADARVHEEADAPDDGGDLLSAILPEWRTPSSDADGRGQRVGDLLDGRRPGLLEVVAADVDRVPLGDRGARCRRWCRRSVGGWGRAGRCRCPGSGTP